MAYIARRIEAVSDQHAASVLAKLTALASRSASFAGRDYGIDGLKAEY
jgi:hypothetical protein